MLKAPTEFIVAFIIVSVILMLALVVIITVIIYKYQQKQNIYFKEIETLKSTHQNALLKSQLEIQEQTFQHISREIHDNIGQKLTLAKLHLNTLGYTEKNQNFSQVNDAVNMISEAINDLSDLNHSLSSEIILNNGLIMALECEAAQLKKSGIFKISFTISGNPVFLSADTELVLFRIVQEALNNIIKHARADEIKIILHYDNTTLKLEINDNGKGFNAGKAHTGTGLQNIKTRAGILKGDLCIKSSADTGTQVIIKIPLHENNSKI